MRIDILNVSDDSTTGYILEVDIEYPQCLHDLHSDFPFLPINKCVKGSKQQKLLTMLENNEKYVTLKQAVNDGLKDTKIHSLQFSQKPWLKPYIDLNTSKRQQAKNIFEIDLFKLMNISAYGKCMENIRKRITLELVCNEKKIT